MSLLQGYWHISWKIWTDGYSMRIRKQGPNSVVLYFLVSPCYSLSVFIVYIFYCLFHTLKNAFIAGCGLKFTERRKNGYHK